MLNILKKILKELKPYKKMVIIMAISGVVMSLAMTRLPLLLKDIVNSLEKHDLSSFKQNAMMVIVFTAISATARFGNIFCMNLIAEYVTNGLRLKLQKKFMRLNLSFYNNYSSGSGGMISRILNDITFIFHGLRMVADFFTQPIQLFFMIGLLFYLNWKATVTIIGALPIIVFFLQKMAKVIRKNSEIAQNQLEKITSTIKESLDGVRVIQSFNLEKMMADRLEDDSNRYLESRKKVHARAEISGPVTELLATTIIVGLVVYFAIEISNGSSTWGHFLSFVAAIMMLNPPIKKIQESYVRMQEMVVAAERVYSILDEQSEVPQAKATKVFPKDWKKIEYRDVSFSYGNEMILKNINLTINRGDVVAFVGESGSGKSTMVNLLERFFDPTSGTILIDDTPIDEIKLEDLRHNIALVTQDVFLFSDSVEKNIWAGDFAKDKNGVELASKSANAHEFISRTPQGYQSRAGDRGSLFSGGEKQRISIARAFFKDSPILILDEATSALDSASEVEVQKGLDSLMSGRTALVVAHRLSTVSRADKIIVLKKGEVIETGKHQDLVNSGGEYSRFYKLQITH